MNYEALYDRILQRVDTDAYLAWADSVPESQRAAMAELGAYIQSPEFDPGLGRTMARRMQESGRIDRLMYLSALHVIAMSPGVKDYSEAARLVAEREQLALSLGGPDLDIHLAGVDRHRGALAFYQGHYGVALDYFSRAFERQRSPGNLSNVLTTLIRLGDVDEARELLGRVRQSLPATLVSALETMIQLDPDLALLRVESRP